jgi:hypothetical protein
MARVRRPAAEWAALIDEWHKSQYVGQRPLAKGYATRPTCNVQGRC